MRILEQPPKRQRGFYESLFMLCLLIICIGGSAGIALLLFQFIIALI
jgi:hypothetical protein